MTGQVDGEFLFGLGSLLGLSAGIWVVALAFDEPQQFGELIGAASVAAGPGLWKLVVGQGIPFTGSTRTRQTFEMGLLSEEIDSGQPAGDGLVRGGTKIQAFVQVRCRLWTSLLAVVWSRPERSVHLSLDLVDPGVDPMPISTPGAQFVLDAQD